MCVCLCVIAVDVFERNLKLETPLLLSIQSTQYTIQKVYNPHTPKIWSLGRVCERNISIKPYVHFTLTQISSKSIRHSQNYIFMCTYSNPFYL